MIRVLLVDDDVDTHILVDDLLRQDRARFDLHSVKTLRTARRLMKADEVDVLLVDRRLTGNDGQNLHAEISARYPYLPTIVMTSGPLTRGDEPTEAWATVDKTELSFESLSALIETLHRQTTERRKQRDAWSFLSASIDALMDGVVVVGDDLNRILSNDEWQAKHGTDIRLTDWKAALGTEAEGRVILDGLDMLMTGARSYFQHEMSFGDGRWVHVSMVAFYHEGRRYGVVTEKDITENRSLKSQIEDAHYRDPVTGLPSRSELLDVLKCTLEVGVPAIVLLININDFRSINHEYGYDGGDEALALVGQRIRNTLNSSAFVARLGNDEFVVVIRGVLDRTTANRFADDIVLGLNAPIVIAKQNVMVSVRIGISSPRIGMSVAETLRLAELAMLAVKSNPENSWRHYDSSMKVLGVHKVHSPNELTIAMAGDELHLTYEPIVDLSSKKVVAVEAHVAWNHPLDGLQNAKQVSLLAEKCGMAEDLAFWMIDALSADNTRIRDRFPDAENIFLSVTAGLVTTGAFAKAVGQVPSIALQLREDVFRQPNESLNTHISVLKSLDIPIWLDRFGGGDTALLNIASVKFAGVKLDPGFGRLQDPESRAKLINSLLAFCQQMQWKTLVLGMDEAELVPWFAERGWELGQGRFFGQPRPVDDLVLEHRTG